jgi:hypothetical protein
VVRGSIDAAAPVYEAGRRHGGEAAVEAEKRLCLCVWETPKGTTADEGRLAFHGPSMQYSSGPVAL